MKKLLFAALALCFALSASAVELKSEGRDTAYVAAIVKRSAKIVDKLGLKDQAAIEAVTHIIANRYFELNDIYEVRDAKLEAAKALTGDERKAMQEAARWEADSKLYRSHFAYPATLALYLNEEQIEAVMDGMTFGVVGVTYKATCDMIPSLTEEEKAQIMTWLKEARELAVDAESSRKKHEVFGKYKGRINNYLSKRGYNLTAEREAWYERIEAEKAKAEKKNKKRAKKQ
ncbi:MAG: DUF3826 domain-containing protein [Alistipes sp.]|nr:DUF3826 domain-containing protein [Alistipes sp.]